MSYGNFIRAFKEFGPKETFWKLFQLRTLKFGRLVGVDKFGNKYFENTKDYPYGQHRWVEYNGDYGNNYSFYDAEPTTVGPTNSSDDGPGWHAWLHAVTDEPPSSDAVSTREPKQAVSESDAPYLKNLGGVLADFQPNMTQMRPRGYGQGNGAGIKSQPGEEKYWTQPGWAMDERHHHSSNSTGFTVADSYDDVKKLQATFAAEGLSEDEEAFLDDHDGDELRAELAKFDEIIDAYSGSSIPEAKAGVAEAEAQRAALADKLSRWDTLNAKYLAAAKA